MFACCALFLHGYKNISRTDVECTWKKQKVVESTKSVEEMYPPKQYNPLKRKANNEDKAWLFDRLKRYGEFTGMTWLLSPEPNKENKLPIPTVEEIILSNEFVESGLSTEFFLDKLKVTEKNVREVVQVTSNQRDSDAWHMLRKGRLTASNFGPVLQAKRVTPSLITRVIGEYDISRVQAVRWGIVNEKEGIKNFTQHSKLQVRQTGLWLHPSGVLGASPDGLVGQNAVLEVKCPYTQRNSTITEAASCSSFLPGKEGPGVCPKEEPPLLAPGTRSDVHHRQGPVLLCSLDNQGNCHTTHQEGSGLGRKCFKPTRLLYIAHDLCTS